MEMVTKWECISTKIKKVQTLVSRSSIHRDQGTWTAIFFSQVYSLYFFSQFGSLMVVWGLGFWVLDWVLGVGNFSWWGSWRGAFLVLQGSGSLYKHRRITLGKNGALEPVPQNLGNRGQSTETGTEVKISTTLALDKIMKGHETII